MSKLILLVEDSDDDVLLFKRTLKKVKLGNPIHHSPTVDDAIRYLTGEGPFADREKFPYPSLAFIDLKLPGRNGFDLLHWFKQQKDPPPLYLVVLAGVGRSLDIAKAYDLGADSFLTKPIKPEDLQTLAESHRHLW